MPIKTFYFSLLSFVVLFSGSCNKTKNYEELDKLLEKNWKLTSIEKGSEEISKPCDLDDVLIFLDTKTYEVQYNDFCEGQEYLNYRKLKWSLIDNYQVIKMKFKVKDSSLGHGNDAWAVLRWRIKELTDTTLVLVDDDTDQTPEIKTYLNVQ